MTNLALTKDEHAVLFSFVNIFKDGLKNDLQKTDDFGPSNFIKIVEKNLRFLDDPDTIRDILPDLDRKGIPAKAIPLVSTKLNEILGGLKSKLMGLTAAEMERFYHHLIEDGSTKRMQLDQILQLAIAQYSQNPKAFNDMWARGIKNALRKNIRGMVLIGKLNRETQKVDFTPSLMQDFIRAIDYDQDDLIEKLLLDYGKAIAFNFIPLICVENELFNEFRFFPLGLTDPDEEDQ